MNEIIELFKKADFIKRGKPNKKILNSISFSKFIDFNQSVEALIASHHEPVFNPVFSQAADPNLGGGSEECSVLNCRLERIDNLARYALLYSDEVYIESFFGKYTELDKEEYFEYFKNEFYNDLIVLNHILPLIENGVIKLYSPNRDACFSCQAKNILGHQSGQLFDNASKNLYREVAKSISVSCELIEDEYLYTINGLDKYFDHGTDIMGNYAFPALLKRQSILSKIIRGDKVLFSKSLTKELGFEQELAHTFIHNAMYGISTSAVLNTSLLTRSEKQIEFINSLNHEETIRANNHIAQEHLSSLVPFVEDVSIKNLIKLREREKESFINYRSALKTSLNHYKNIKGKFTQFEAREFYSDILEPQLANLEINVNKAKRDLINKPVRSLVGVVGVLSFGMLSGLFPENIYPIAQLVGLTKFGTDLIKDTIKIDDKENNIINDKFYFLWKVKNIANR